MGSVAKGKRKIRKRVAAFCEENNYTLISFGDGKGKKHGQIKVEANGRVITVGFSSSPNGGWESSARMVVDHIKRKIRDGHVSPRE